MTPNIPSKERSESGSDEPFGAALLRCFREEGLPLSTMSYATIQALKIADRAETIRALRECTPGAVSYALIQQLKKDTPERIADRLVMQHRIAAQQMTMMMLFMG